jgi:hypothetical protein
MAGVADDVTVKRGVHGTQAAPVDVGATSVAAWGSWNFCANSAGWHSGTVAAQRVSPRASVPRSSSEEAHCVPTAIAPQPPPPQWDALLFAAAFRSAVCGGVV